MRSRLEWWIICFGSEEVEAHEGQIKACKRLEKLSQQADKDTGQMIYKGRKLIIGHVDSLILKKAQDKQHADLVRKEMRELDK